MEVKIGEMQQKKEVTTVTLDMMKDSSRESLKRKRKRNLRGKSIESVIELKPLENIMQI